MGLEVITGPMFSGKSEELIRRLRRSKIAGKNVILVSPRLDTRNEDAVVTHAGAEFPCVKAYTAGNVLAISENYDVVGIDEIQFFEPSIKTAILFLANRITVIVSGLDTNYRYEPFGIVPDLMAYSDKVDKLTAVCNVCGEDATKTQRLIDGKPAPITGPEILVGGLDSYEARCRECFRYG